MAKIIRDASANSNQLCNYHGNGLIAPNPFTLTVHLPPLLQRMRTRTRTRTEDKAIERCSPCVENRFVVLFRSPFRPWPLGCACANNSERAARITADKKISRDKRRHHDPRREEVGPGPRAQGPGGRGWSKQRQRVSGGT